jgi:hypothetical protein
MWLEAGESKEKQKPNGNTGREAMMFASNCPDHE